MIIYAHRGIDLDRTEKLPENSLASFQWAAENGVGIELDLQMTRDQYLIVAHDSTMERWSEGAVKKTWAAMDIQDIAKLGPVFSSVALFSEVLDLATRFSDFHLAVHLKGIHQTGFFVQKLIEALLPRLELHSRILIFDLKPELGRALHRALPGVGLAPSVADDYDVMRFQSATGGTLFNLEDALLQKQIFNWVWLDEWDRIGAGETTKAFYNEDNMVKITKRGFKIAMISPELHAADGHQDGASLKTLQKRWQSMRELKPDAICTNYPARLLKSLTGS